MVLGVQVRVSGFGAFRVDGGRDLGCRVYGIHVSAGVMAARVGVVAFFRWEGTRSRRRTAER